MVTGENTTFNCPRKFVGKQITTWATEKLKEIKSTYYRVDTEKLP